MTVNAVERCLAIIEVLAGEAEPMELSEIARRVELPASAGHRILATLLARGWVVQDRATQSYALSLRLSTLAFRNLDARAVPDVVQAVLDRLAKRTAEYCRLAIVEGEDLVWIARAQGAPPGLRYDPDMGQEIVLHATANGKAWLSTLPESEALRIVCARGFKSRRPLGPRAVNDVESFRRELAQARDAGYAKAVDEAEAGTAALAVPFFAGLDPQSPVAGTISAAGPILRVSPARYEALAAELKVASREIAEIWPLRIRQRNSPPAGVRATVSA